jgi:hypothetical protein
MNPALQIAQSQLRSRWFRRHPRTSAVGVGVLLTVVLMGTSELALRRFAPAWLRERMQVRQASCAMTVGSDSESPVVRRSGKPISYAPGSRFPLVHPEYATEARIDELGGRAFTNLKVGAPVLPVLGDSFTFGLGVNDDQSFVALLQPYFTQRLLNLGMIGASLPHYRFVIEQRHAELGQPPVYLVCLFLGNDLNDLIRLQSVGSRSESSRAESRSAFQLRRINYEFETRWIGDLYLFQSLKSLLSPVVNRQRTEPLLDPIFALIGSDSAYQQHAFGLFSEEIDALAAVVRERRVSPLFVLVPDRYQVIADRRVRKAAYYSIPAGALDPLAPNRRVAAILEGHGMRYIDPTLELMAAPENDRFYYQYDPHMTASGHAFLAQVLSRRLPAMIAEMTRPAIGE